LQTIGKRAAVASYVYLPKLRDGVVLEQSIQEALNKLDAKFGYAESFDAASTSYSGLIYAKTAPDVFGPSALSALPPIADIRSAQAYVRFVPKADITEGLYSGSLASRSASLNDAASSGTQFTLEI
jgi:hypothetical protein